MEYQILRWEKVPDDFDFDTDREFLVKTINGFVLSSKGESDWFIYNIAAIAYLDEQVDLQDFLDSPSSGFCSAESWSNYDLKIFDGLDDWKYYIKTPTVSKETKLQNAIQEFGIDKILDAIKELK